MNLDEQIGKMSLPELKALKKQIDRAIDSVGEKKRQDALDAIKAAAEQHGFKLGELVDAEVTKTRKQTRPPSKFYINPQDPHQRWSGRGRRPAWFLELEAAGQEIPQVDA